MNKTYEEVGLFVWDGLLKNKTIEGAKEHHNSGVCSLSYWGDGEIFQTKWFRHGVLHREDGPAEITFIGVWPGDPRTLEELERAYKVRSKYWYLNGQLWEEDFGEDFGEDYEEDV